MQRDQKIRINKNIVGVGYIFFILYLMSDTILNKQNKRHMSKRKQRTKTLLEKMLDENAILNCELNDSCTYNFSILFQFLCNVILTFISGCSGGQKFVFMSIGGGIGNLYDNFTSVPHIQSIIIGIAAFFSTIFGNPISSALIIMKTTKLSYEALPMLIAASLVSYHTSKYINEKI